MKVTIRDVAKKAGVSHTTVSMVINNDKRITVETREKVQRAIEEMNFHPDEMARNLAKGGSDTIGFISPRLVSPSISAVLEGMENQAYDLNRYDYGIEPLSIRKSLKMKKDVLEKILYGRKVSALVIMSIKPAEKLVNDLKSKGIPVILLENRVDGAHSIRIDNFKGAYKATEYLIKRGRKKIGLISGGMTPLFEDMEIFSPVSERFEGYKAALRDNGIEYDPDYTKQAYTFAFEEGKEAMNSFLDGGLKPDGIFCAAGDIVAMGAMEQAKLRGVKIPGDMSLIGYDDIFFSKLVSPGLTTIKQPLNQMGREAFDTAIAAIEGKLSADKELMYEPELIIRESV